MNEDDDMSDFEAENVFSSTSVFSKIKSKLPPAEDGSKLAKLPTDEKSKFSGLSGFKGLKLPKRENTNKLSNLMNLGKINGFSDVSDPETVSVSDVIKQKSSAPKILESRSTKLPEARNGKPSDKTRDATLEKIVECQNTTLEKIVEGQNAILEKIVEGQNAMLEKVLETGTASVDKYLDIIVAFSKSDKSVSDKPISDKLASEKEYFEKFSVLVAKKLENFVIGTYDESGLFVKSGESLEEILSKSDF